MKRKEIFNLVVETICSIQKRNGKEFGDIDENTVPIGQLQGFDSYTDVEFTTEIDVHIPIDKGIRLCVANDGKTPLNVGQIVNQLVNIYGEQKQGEKNGKK
jgi:hypothetical protein